jgi:hypothetical protein
VGGFLDMLPRLGARRCVWRTSLCLAHVVAHVSSLIVDRCRGMPRR